MQECGGGIERGVGGGELTLTDSHAHVADGDFDGDREAVLARAREAGVRRIISPGADLERSMKAVRTAGAQAEVYAAVGVSPHEAGKVRGEDWEALAVLAAEAKVVAWGEIGLDYRYEFADRRTQKEALTRQLGLARELGLPVIFHFREAGADFFDLVEREGLPERGGVMHCFTGTREEMRTALEMGLFISFSGIVTFRKVAAEYAELLAEVADDRLLIETDSPYLAPEPYRGRRAEPFMVAEVARRVAEVRGMSPAAAARLTTENAARLFGLPHQGI